MKPDSVRSGCAAARPWSGEKRRRGLGYGARLVSELAGLPLRYRPTEDNPHKNGGEAGQKDRCESHSKPHAAPAGDWSRATFAST